jgi:hypothetical protein
MPYFDVEEPGMVSNNYPIGFGGNDIDPGYFSKSDAAPEHFMGGPPTPPPAMSEGLTPTYHSNADRIVASLKKNFGNNPELVNELLQTLWLHSKPNARLGDSLGMYNPSWRTSGLPAIELPGWYDSPRPLPVGHVDGWLPENEGKLESNPPIEHNYAHEIGHRAGDEYRQETDERPTMANWPLFGMEQGWQSPTRETYTPRDEDLALGGATWFGPQGEYAQSSPHEQFAEIFAAALRERAIVAPENSEVIEPWMVEILRQWIPDLKVIR